MRIISGSNKGKKLEHPKTIRPTRDFVKEAVFNIIGSCQVLVVMDVCAGSGALGIEALSRGAKKVIFIEQDTDNCKVIQRNLDSVQNGVHGKKSLPRHDGASYEIIYKAFEDVYID